METVKENLESAFYSANHRNYYLAKKAAQSIRKLLNKNLKLTRDSNAKIELIAFFCEKMREFGYLDYRHPVIPNLYALQVRKIEKLIALLHEDLQFDYRELLERLSEPVR